jgi:hypothetical protein
MNGLFRNGEMKALDGCGREFENAKRILKVF